MPLVQNYVSAGQKHSFWPMKTAFLTDENDISEELILRIGNRKKRLIHNDLSQLPDFGS